MLQEQEGTGGAAQAPEARARGQQPGRHGGHQAQVSNAEHKVCSVHFVLFGGAMCLTTKASCLHDDLFSSKSL